MTNQLTEKEAGVVIDVAHESLIRHWQQLQQWVNENREAIRMRRLESGEGLRLLPQSGKANELFHFNCTGQKIL